MSTKKSLMNRDSFIKSLIPIRSLGPNMNGVNHINKKQNFKELLGFLKAGRKSVDIYIIIKIWRI